MISNLDHMVLTTRDRHACIRFYTDVLGMQLETFGAGRIAFKFGSQKINLHEYGREFSPKAECPTPGSLDICFISSVPLEDVIAKLRGLNVSIEEGPVTRTGANWPIRSIYVRDPDKNLIEIAEKFSPPITE